MQTLINSEPTWHIIIRPFLRKITSKQQYQLYLRAILQSIIDSVPSESNFKPQNELKSNHKKSSMQES